jgi:uncharacterized protein involved in exopolysaccharide biosynthesis
MNLSEEDKTWIAGQLRAEMRAEIGTLRAEIGTLRAEMRTEFGAVRSEIGTLHSEIGTLHSEIGTLRAELRAEIERVETSLLTEFHKWASPVELRIKSHATAMRALDLELEDVKERLSKLEPPQ